MKKSLLSIALLLSAVAYLPSLTAANLRNPIQSKMINLQQQREKALMRLNELQRQKEKYLKMVNQGVDVEDLLEQAVTSIESTTEEIDTLQQDLKKGLAAVSVLEKVRPLEEVPRGKRQEVKFH